MKLKGITIKNSIVPRFSPEHKEEMSGYDAEWESSGAFPSRDDSRPIITKNDGSSSDGDEDHIFVDEGLDGAFDSLKTVNEGSRETASSSHDGLMALSHSSSETPAISNTTTDVVRNALKKRKKLQKSGIDCRIEGIYPYNMFRSLSKGKEEGQEKNDKDVTNNGRKFPNTSPGQTPRNDNKREKYREYQPTSPPILRPLPVAMEDEASSVITDEQHEHNQYVYDYMAEGASVHPPISVMSARSRRHGGGGKHHLVRHTLATSQKVTANPANMLKNIFISIEEERHMHRLTAQHLRAIHNWLLFLPSILLALLAGVVVLVFEADLNSSDSVRVYSSISVGVLSLISVFWQALCKQLDFGVKSALHDTCSVALKRLSEDILLTMSAAETIPAEYVALIGEKYGQAADACPSNIPYKLEAASSHLSNRMIIMLRPPMGQAPRKYLQKLDLLRLYATAYDELSAEVINYFAFPFAFPDSRRASEAALRNFKAIITEGKEVDRSRHCKLLCPCFGSPDEERSLFDVLPAAAAGVPLAPSQVSI